MWEQIRSNQIRSVVLTFGMGVLLLAVGYFLGAYFFGSPTGGLVLAFIVWAIMSLVAYFEGDSIFLSMSNARKISRDDYPRLYNLVEEMKIASGLEKMPDIYIIDDPALNAFATGRNPKHAALAVTSGLLQKLNRDELQGVIGHEIGHIKNRDVLLMVMAGILMGSIVILSWYASRAMFYSGMSSGRRDSRSGGGQGQAIIAIVGIVLMILAPIAAELMYFAISRRREYLSDASSALYTRYPEGLASALEKLATSDVKVRTANKANAPMYIANPFQKRGLSAENLTSTHPPIAERIRILRSMAGASYMDYEMSYEQTKKQKLMPASALVGAEKVAVRLAQPGSVLDEKAAQVERARETSHVLWGLSGYKTIGCPCGARLRVPPNYEGNAVRCPHCGRVHQV